MAASNSNISFDAIVQDIRNRTFRPVYYLMGEEPYYIDQLDHLFATEVLDEMEQEFNQTIIYGQDADLPSILTLARRYPMMAERQVIIVREAQNLRVLDPLVSYLQHPQTSTVLVFCHKNGSLDKRKKVVGEMQRAGLAIFESSKVNENALPTFISRLAADHSCTIDVKATAMLIEAIGNNLTRIVSEMEKLFVNMSTGDTVITPDMVETYTGISKDYNVFELKNSLARRDIARANRIANYMEDNPKTFPPQAVFPILFQYFSNLMLAYYAPQRNVQSIGEYIGQRWGADEYVIGIQNYSAFKVMDIISEIRRYDGMSKGVGATTNVGRGLIRQLVWFILH